MTFDTAKAFESKKKRTYDDLKTLARSAVSKGRQEDFSISDNFDTATYYGATRLKDRVNDLQKKINSGNSEIIDYLKSAKWSDDYDYKYYNDRVKSLSSETSDFVNALKKNQGLYNELYGESSINELVQSFDSAKSNFSELLSKIKNKKNIFSKWKSEDEYKAFTNTQKYKDYSYDDIQKEIESKRKNGADEKEINWLKNFAVSKNYATSDDYSKALDGANSRISELKTQKKEYELERRRAYKYNSKETQNKLAEYDKQIKQAKKDRDALESGKELKRRDDIIQGEMSVQNNADFSDVSANRELNNPSRDELKKYDMRIDTGTWYTDGTGDYYNSLGEKIGKDTGEYLESHKNNGINDKLGLYLSAYNSEYDLKEAAALAGYNDTWADTVTEGVNGYWQELSENEKAVYYYYLNKGERDKAYKFLDDMGYQLGLRANEKEKAELEGANALLLIAANAASVPANVFGGIAAFVSDTANVISGKGVNSYDKAHSAVNSAQNVRDETAQRIADGIDNDVVSALVSNGYQAVMSGADSLLGAATLGSGYTVAMGMGAASQKAKELYENGASRGQIALGSLASGAIEWITEKFSYDFIVDKLWNNPKSGRALIKAVLASAANEGIEEVNSDILNMVSDAIIQGGNSVSERDVRELINSTGVSEEEARNTVAAQNAINAFWSFYGGFISGGLMSGGGLALNLSQNALMDAAYETEYKKQSGKNIVDGDNVNALVEVARGLDDTKANIKLKALAEQIAATDTEKLSARQQAAFSNKVGKLYSEVQKAQATAHSESTGNAVRTVIEEKVKEKGVTDESNIKTATDAIFKTVYDEGKLSSSEDRLLKKYDLNGIATELLNDEENVMSHAIKAENETRGAYFETAKLADTDNSSARNVDTSDYDISDDGKTYRSDTGKEVKITGISTIKNGKMTVNLSDGSSTALDNISLGSNNDAILYEGVLQMGVNAGSAQMIVNSYSPALGMTPLNYIRGVQDAVKYGKIGSKSFLNSGIFSGALPEQIRNSMYRVGEIEAERTAQKKAKAKEKYARKNANVKSNNGNVSFRGIDRNSLNERQGVSVNAVEAVFGEIGINVVFFQSETNENGVHIGKNGSYDPETNTIELDVSAGVQGKDTVLFTAAHELTHFIAEWSPDKFKVFANFLVKNYERKGINVNQIVEERMQTAEANGRELDYDTAFEEVIADSCESFLRDSHLADRLVELAKADMTLFEKIKSYIKGLLEKVRKAYAGLLPDSKEGRFVLEMKESLEQLHDMWEEAALDARENFKATDSKSAGEGSTKYSFAGERAETVDKSFLEAAKERLENGEDAETVRKETGWFKGYDDKWRFEISDFESHLIENPKLKRHEADGEIYFTGRLSDILEHKELFKAYPELKNINIIIQPTDAGVQGVYQKKSNYITLDINLFKRHTKEYSDYLNGGRKTEIERIEQTPEYKEYSKYHDDPAFENLDPEIWLKEEKAAQKKFFDSELGKRYYELNWGKNGFTGQKFKLGWNNGAEAVLVHELQHAIQGIEEFAGGSSPKHWSLETKNAEAEYSKKQAEYEKRLDGFADVLYRHGYTDDDFEKNDITTESGIEEAKQFLKKAEAPNGAIELADNLKQYAKDRDEAFSYYWRLKKGNPSELYKATAGEIEARDAEKRLNYTAEQRKNTRPDIDRKDVVFADGGTSYSIAYTTDNKPVAVIDEDILDGVPRSQWIQTVKDTISSKFSDGIPISGRLIKVNKITRSEYTNSKYSKFLKSSDGTMYQDKLKTANNLDDVVLASANYINEDLKHSRKDSFKEFARGDVLVRVGGNDYSAKVIVGFTNSRQMVLYDVVDFNKTAFKIKKGTSQTAMQNAGSDRNGMPYDITVPQNEQSVNTNISEKNRNDTKKFSERDSEGNTLSKGQQEYFKDSKVRDVDGNLKVMYHGSPNAVFTVFKSGTYFTELKWYADRYQSQGASSLGYKKTANNPDTYAVYLNIKKPFDTRNKAERKIFYNEYYQQWGTGTDLMESGLPDWLDGQDLQEFLEEKGYDYDGLILDEGGTGGYGEEVKSRGLSYVVFSPEQVKNIDNKTPTKNPDIRYSDRNPEAMVAYAEINKQLEREKAEMSEDLSRAKELVRLQNKLTHGTVFTDSSMDVAARTLMNYVNAKGEKSEFKELLKDFYGYIAKGEDLSWESVKEKSEPVINWLRDHEYHKAQRSEFADSVLKDLRTKRIALNDNQKQEAADLYGSYEEFRKRNMGRIIITDSGVSLDTQWAELAKAYPTLFDESITSAEQPVELMSIIEGLQNNDVNEYFFSNEMAEQDLFSKVYDTYWNVSTLHTVKDRMQTEINKLKAKHNEKIREMRNNHTKKDNELKQRYTERTAELRKYYKEREAQIAKDASERYQRSREGIAKTQIRGSIKKVITDLNGLLNQSTKKRNVKEGLKDTVSAALYSAEILFSPAITNEDIIRNGVKSATAKEMRLIAEYTDLLNKRDDYSDRIRTLGDMTASTQRNDTIAGLQNMIDYVNRKIAPINKELHSLFERERNGLYKAPVSVAIDALANAYSALKSSETAYIRNVYDDFVYNRIVALKDSLDGALIKDMNMAQLTELRDAYKMVLHTVREANKLFGEEKKATVTETADKVSAEIRRVGGSKEKQLVLTSFLKKQGWKFLKPVYAFRTIGSDTLTELYNDIRYGEDRFKRMIDKAIEAYKSAGQKYNSSKWDTEKTYTFQSRNGKEFSLSLQQIMEIYGYSKRNQAMKHLVQGGIVLDNSVIVKEKTRLGVPLKYEVNAADAYGLNEEIIGKIADTLTPEQKSYVDELQSYLTELGEEGNKVSMALYGIKLFKEQNYLPIKSAEWYSNFSPDSTNEFSMRNSAFTKETNQFANNPIVLSNFNDVFGRHVNDMAMYCSFVLPLENFMKVFNYHTAATADSDARSVRGALKNAYGDGAEAYIRQLLRDLNGGVRAQSGAEIVNKLTGLAKKGAVFASASVTVQQISAIPRAMAYINAKYFATTANKSFNLKRHKSDWEEMKKWAPIAGIKEMGYFDTGLGRSTVNYITAEEYEGLKDKFGAFFKDSDFRDEILSKGPAFIDEIGWVSIWNAVKRETAEKTNLEVGSAEFFEKCSKRATEVITLTQVYDSVFSRSELMRSKDTGLKMTTAFMAEPTTVLNMVFDAALQAKRTGNFKFLGKALGSVLTSIVLNELLKALVTAGRDDDDDKTWLEKYISKVRGGVLDSINPLNYMPYTRDIMSLLSGYDVDRMDMAMFADLAKAIRRLQNSEEHQPEDWINLVTAMSAFAGIPAKNIYRDIKTAVNTFNDMFLSDNTTSVYGVEQALTGGSGYKNKAKIAFKHDDAAGVSNIVSQVEGKKVRDGKTEKQAKASVRSSFTATYKKKYLKAYKKGNIKEQNRIRSFLYATGLYGSLSELDAIIAKWIENSEE